MPFASVRISQAKIQVFKPVIDDRYHKEDVTSHNYNSIKATAIKNSEEIWYHLQDDTQVVGIDEGQFFDVNIVEVVQLLAQRGIRVLSRGFR